MDQVGDSFKTRLKILLASDEHRVSVQTTAAVLLAFVATLFMGRENMSWGVFSALFVVQASVGGTVSSGLERVAGAILGAAVGVLAVLLPIDGLMGTLVSLLIGVSVMSLVSARWPKLAYGLVTVTIIIVAPDFYVVEGAMEKIAAIGIGSACGVAAALAVFPVSARRRADRHLAEALRGCGRLLDEYFRCMQNNDNKDDVAKADADVSYALRRARDMSRQARAERAPMTPADLSSGHLLYEVERFRYTLTLIDRFSDGPLPESLPGDRDGFDALCDAVNQQLERLADAIVSHAACEPVPEVKERFDDWCRSISDTLNDESMTQPDRERLIAIKEAYAAMLDNLIRLCQQVSERYAN